MATSLKSIMSTVMKADTLKSIAKTTGVNAKDVSSILSSALPALLNGASKQSTSAKTSSSFAEALQSHAKADTTNLTSFFKKVDAQDGLKIVGHLLGKSNTTETKKIAKQTGIDIKTVTSVLAVAAPLLMSLIGKKAKAEKKDDKDAVASIASSLLGSVDLGSLIGGLLKK